MTDKMSKVVIIGGAGFIGTNLALSALRKGIGVVIFDNLSRKGASLNLEHLMSQSNGSLINCKGDVRSYKDVKELFGEHGDAQCVFHLAAQVAVTGSVSDPRTDFEINLVGTFNVLEAMRQYAIEAPLIYSSTNKVYGAMEDLAVEEGATRYRYVNQHSGIGETFPLSFHSPYGCSKGGGDQYVLDYARIFGLHTVVFRQSCIYGYHQFGIEDQGWLAWFTIATLFDQPITIYGNGKQVRDILFIDDLLEAFWAAAGNIDKTSGQVYNIGGGRFNISLLEFCDLLQDILHKKIIVSFDEPRPGDQPIFVSDIGKASRDFGWVPKIGVEKGVEKLVGWIADNKQLFRSAGVI